MNANRHRSEFLWIRRTYTWLLGISVSLGITAAAPAQEKTEKTIEDKTIQSTVDGWPLKFTYYRSTAGKNASVVVLLHGKSESRLVWTGKGGFAEELQHLGYAVIALDLRKHGQSKLGDTDADDIGKKDKSSTKKGSGGSELKSGDYQAMVLDMKAVKRFIFDEHQAGRLNMRKTAIIAPAMSASIALLFAANDWAEKPWDDASTPAARTPKGQDVQALVLLSPETTVPGLKAFEVVPTLKVTPLAALVMVGKTDPLDKDQSQKLFQQLGGDLPKTTPATGATTKKAEPKKGKDKDADKAEKQRLYFVEPNVKLRGTELLGKKLPVTAKTTVEDVISAFLGEHLQKLEGPFYDWRDRKSPLQN